MRQLIVEAGWGVFPVILCGAMAVLVSAAFAVSLRRELIVLWLSFAGLTLLTGVLGVTTGLRAVCGNATAHGAADMLMVVAGAREAMGTILVALALTIVGALFGVVAGLRIAWRGAKS